MTDLSEKLLECEAIVRPSDELLWRQVTDHTWDSQAGKPGSAAFGPMPIDRKRPSFTRQSVVTAQQARDWHQDNAKSPSRGVWACSTAEIDELDLRTVDDSDCPPEINEQKAPGHCYIDYRGVPKSNERVLRKLLLASALNRGPVWTEDKLQPAPAE